MRMQKAAQRQSFNPAELAASKPLASEQASEDVVGGANTTFGGATRALGKYASIIEAWLFLSRICPVTRVSPRTDIRARRCNNSHCSPASAAEKLRPHVLPNSRSAASGLAAARKLKRTRTRRASRTLDSRATAAPTP